MNARISARIASFVVMGSTLLAASSCLRETPGYCAYAGGNSACEATYDGTFCIFQGPDFVEEAEVEYRNVNEAQRLGCYESLPMMLYGPDEVMDFYGCVPAGLTDDNGDLFDDLLELRKKTGYDLADFLGEHGGIPGVSLAECRSDSDTSSDTSDSSTATTGMESSTTEGVSSESTTGSTMSCTENEHCTEIEDPQCVDGVCRACIDGGGGDAACAELDMTRPLCAGGTCVECTPADPAICDAQDWVCDGSTGSCVPCTEHAQCSSGACELAVGLCFPDDFVVHVDGDGDGGADYMTIVAAVADVPDDAHGVIVVHELDGGDDYGPTVINGGNKTIALLAAPGESPIIQGTADQGLRVSEAGIMVYVDGLTIAGNTSGRGLRVDLDAHVWVDRSRIVQNSGGGIQVDGGAVLTLRNCFVGGSVDTSVLEVQGATAEVLYSTLGASLGMTTSLACDASSTVTVRNSLIVSRSDDEEVVCRDVDATYTAAETLLDGTENIALESMDPAWFAGFNAGDFDLSGTHPVAIDTAAEWRTGDPTTDIDGDPRPTVNVTPDYAGADVP